MKLIYIATFVFLGISIVDAASTIGTENDAKGESIQKMNYGDILFSLENIDIENVLTRLEQVENTSHNTFLEVKSVLHRWMKLNYREKLFAALKDQMPNIVSNYNLLVEVSGPWGPVYKGFFLADKIYYFSASKGEIHIFAIMRQDDDFFKAEERLIKGLFLEKDFYGDISMWGFDFPTYVITVRHENNFKTVIIHAAAFPKNKRSSLSEQNRFDSILNSIDTFSTDIIKQAPWKKKQGK